MYFLSTQFNVVLSSIRAARTNFVLARIMSALYSHIPILHLHVLYTPQRSMYFLPTQFNVVLSPICAARTNFVLAHIHERYMIQAPATTTIKVSSSIYNLVLVD